MQQQRWVQQQRGWGRREQRQHREQHQVPARDYQKKSWRYGARVAVRLACRVALSVRFCLWCQPLVSVWLMLNPFSSQLVPLPCDLDPSIWTNIGSSWVRLNLAEMGMGLLAGKAAEMGLLAGKAAEMGLLAGKAEGQPG